MNNSVIKSGIKNTIYVVTAQTISLFLGIARALFLPILLGITQFGYWQVYLLYLSYVGIFALGFNDGIYLKYGKYEYNELPKERFRSSIRLFIMFQIIITLILSTFILFESDPSKQIAMFWAIINIPIAGLTGVLIYVLQITNQLKKYSFYTILDKIVVLVIITIIYFLRLNNYVVIVIADTFARVLVLFLMMKSCNEIIFGNGIKYQFAVKEVFENMRVGIKLMLANLAGMLVLGFGRILIERTASIEEYGTYSFAISTMNLVLVVITGVGLVIYPTLNRLNTVNYPNYFINLNKALVGIVFGLLIVLFPLKLFVSTFMHDYINIFDYLSIIFSIIFVQSKMQILINPFYKLLRKENMMLKTNIIGIVLAIILITPIYLITESVTMVAIGTLLAMLIRLYLSEMYLKKELSITGNKSVVIELLGLILFIILGLLNSVYFGLFVYVLIYFLFLFSHSKDISRFANKILKG